VSVGVKRVALCLAVGALKISHFSVAAHAINLDLDRLVPSVRRSPHSAARHAETSLRLTYHRDDHDDHCCEPLYAVIPLHAWLNIRVFVIRYCSVFAVALITLPFSVFGGCLLAWLHSRYFQG